VKPAVYQVQVRSPRAALAHLVRIARERPGTWFAARTTADHSLWLFLRLHVAAGEAGVAGRHELLVSRGRDGPAEQWPDAEDVRLLAEALPSGYEIVEAPPPQPKRRAARFEVIPTQEVML
jgi:hypothetical protein